jgi:hypothetical protein
MSNTIQNNTQDHINMLLEIIQKNEYLIHSSANMSGKKAYEYNSRLVVSENIEFLEAIKHEMGGEIIKAKPIGTFLYFDDIK